MDHFSRFAHEGFTLTELVVVMMLIGILAVAVVPRFMGATEFHGQGFQDEVAALLRYAQKTAIAQRRSVCVQFPDSQNVTLRIASSAGDTLSCDTNLTGPNGQAPFTVTARTGTGHDQTAAANFSFYGSGRSSLGATLTIGITDSVPRTVTVEPET
ncbi:MAG: type II secretion system protein, partial [Betaproteobacteria bacterium]|nr:type II secretion system protein [Betaproteobacteria bacterium]